MRVNNKELNKPLTRENIKAYCQTFGERAEMIESLLLRGFTLDLEDRKVKLRRIEKSKLMKNGAF
jgi:type I restriction-modification system DNA methylase subunit